MNHFGFQKVTDNEKTSLVSEVFSSVASKYDLMNDLMSLGIHRLWKNKMLEELKNFSGKLLDMAGGTCDISSRFYLKAKKQGFIPDITICDINFDMLKQGQYKLLDKNIINLNFIQANGELLPLEDNNFDYYTIAFGIRNVTDINKLLLEAYRVLKTGGKFICLEFSKVQNDAMRRIYEYYSMNIIPCIGELVAQDRKSYQYLVESIKMFPEQNDFAQMIENAGFKMVKFNNLSNGVVAIHIGYKL